MKKSIKSLIFILIFTIGIIQTKTNIVQAAVTTTSSISVSVAKEWVIKFNNSLKPETINNKNILVTDESNKPVSVSVTVGSSSDTIIVSPIISGYDPGKKYNLTITTNVQSIAGKNLKKPVNMEFTSESKYIDCTSYENLPQITSLKFEFTPLLSTQKQGFFITGKNSDSSQYRVFVHNYEDSKEIYTELTNGYTKLSNGKITSLKSLKASSTGKYKAIVYVKRENIQGAHKDLNTDYDNYYVDYFRCVDSVDNSNVTYTKYNTTLDQMVTTQANLDSKAVFVETNVCTNIASKNQVKYYANPNNFLDNYGKYQFLKLSYSEGITADQLDNILKGKGILEGKGQVFLDAAKDNDINVAYLVSHALLESGNGTSVLANGGAKDSDGKFIYGAPVYNFFGIGAYDSDPIGCGTKAAYDNKWLTPEDAIKGGANWIASKYINNAKCKQDTIYKMRWNPANPGDHQYATDVSWAFKQIPNTIKSMKLIYDQVENPILIFDIPQFK